MLSRDEFLAHAFGCVSCGAGNPRHAAHWPRNLTNRLTWIRTEPKPITNADMTIIGPRDTCYWAACTTTRPATWVFYLTQCLSRRYFFKSQHSVSEHAEKSGSRVYGSRLIQVMMSVDEQKCGFFFPRKEFARIVNMVYSSEINKKVIYNYIQHVQCTLITHCTIKVKPLGMLSLGKQKPSLR